MPAKRGRIPQVSGLEALFTHHFREAVAPRDYIGTFGGGSGVGSVTQKPSSRTRISLVTYLVVRYQTKGGMMINHTVTAVLDAPKAAVFNYLSRIENLTRVGDRLRPRAQIRGWQGEGRERPG